MIKLLPFLVVVLLVICVFVIKFTKGYNFLKTKTKYREKDGILQYRGSMSWQDVKFWSEDIKDRHVIINDCTRCVDFEKNYSGPGIESVKYSEDILKHYKEKYPTIKDIRDDQDEVMEIECNYIKEIL